MVFNQLKQGSNMETQHILKTMGDVTAYGTVVATLFGWLPNIAALFSIIWLGMQMTEKITGKTFHELILCAWDKLRR